MYEVVVVDDEIAVADMMARHIAKLPGFRVAATFYHGLAARDFLQQNHADILLTDIRMPEFTGLDLAEFVARAMPNCAVILISAYSEFEYARRAISLGVLDYISKPVQFRQIDEGLARVARQIDQRRAEIIGEQEMLSEEGDLFFFDLASGKLNDENLFRKRFAGLKAPFPLHGVPCCVVEMAFGAPQKKMELLIEILKRILHKTAPLCHAQFLCASGGSRIFYFVLAGDSLPDAQAMRRLRHAIRQYLNLEAETSVRVVCENFIDMAASPVLRQIQAEQEADNAGDERSGEAEKIQAYIQANLEQPLSRDGVAERFYMSPAYFSRYFKRVCGCSFYEFVRNARMERAMALLKTNRQVQEICEAVGYHDKAYFYKVFQQYTGKTPSEFRRAIRGETLSQKDGEEE